MKSSEVLFKEAQDCIPGGVNSPVRACVNVNSTPLFLERGKGSHVFSVEGREYIDFVQSWGPLLLGHGNPEVLQAIHKAVDCACTYGAPCEDEVRLAEAIIDAVPSIEMVRMVNSGTEATMSALRLARAYTGRDKFIKFEGGYHGHGDAFLASAGSGVATLSLPGTPGVPDHIVADTLLAPYNDLESVEKLFALHKNQIAAIFVEAMAGNMGLVPAKEGFLEGLRRICDENGALLVMDEVITGFRLSYGGAQKRFNVMPDLTTLGKIIGGGMPVGAYGGRKEIMQRIAPAGDVYQAGTLSGNPVAMAAGIATLNVLKKSDYDALERRVEAFCAEMEEILRGKGVPVTINRMASMFTIFFIDEPVTDYEVVKRANSELYTKFYKQMREMGIFMAPSAFECAMVSFAHSDEDLQAALDAARKVQF